MSFVPNEQENRWVWKLIKKCKSVEFWADFIIPTFLLHAHAPTKNLLYKYRACACETCQYITSQIFLHCHSCYCCTFTYHMSYMICMFLFNLCTKFHMPILNCSLVVTMKLKGNKNFHTANMLLFYIPLKYYLNKALYFSQICYHTHFRDLKQVALVLLLLHFADIRCPHTIQWKLVNCFKSSFTWGTYEWTNRCMGRLEEGQAHTHTYPRAHTLW